MESKWIKHFSQKMKKILNWKQLFGKKQLKNFKKIGAKLLKNLNLKRFKKNRCKNKKELGAAFSCNLKYEVIICKIF